MYYYRSIKKEGGLKVPSLIGTTKKDHYSMVYIYALNSKEISKKKQRLTVTFDVN